MISTASKQADTLTKVGEGGDEKLIIKFMWPYEVTPGPFCARVHGPGSSNHDCCSIVGVLLTTQAIYKRTFNHEAQEDREKQ